MLLPQQQVVLRFNLCVMRWIDIKLTNTDSFGLSHNSRQGLRTLTKFCNLIVGKLNEAVDKINALKKRDKQLKANQNEKTDTTKTD